MTQEEIDARFALQFYMRDDELEKLFEGWRQWMLENAPDTEIVMGSSSYMSGRRYITFLFVEEEKAALFRLFHGGKFVEEPVITPTSGS